MELEWQPDYETGNEYVDLQHRYFVDLINRVGINFRETKDKNFLKPPKNLNMAGIIIYIRRKFY
jgi:hemerythrin